MWSGSIIKIRGRCDAIAFVCAMTNIRSCGQIANDTERSEESAGERRSARLLSRHLLCREWLLESAVKLVLWR